MLSVCLAAALLYVVLLRLYPCRCSTCARSSSRNSWRRREVPCEGRDVFPGKVARFLLLQTLSLQLRLELRQDA